MSCRQMVSHDKLTIYTDKSYKTIKGISIGESVCCNQNKSNMNRHSLEIASEAIVQTIYKGIKKYCDKLY